MFKLYRHKQCITFSIFSFLIGCMMTSFFMKIDDNTSVQSHSMLTSFIGQKAVFPVKNSKNYFIIVLVLTSPGNTNQRRVLRETWFKFCGNDDILCYFVLGNPNNLNETQKEQLLVEQSKFKDFIILPDVIESYNSLSKKVLESFKWINENVPNYQFLLKCDDDTFVRLEKVSTELKTHFDGSAGHNLYWGFFDGRAHVKRGGKWQELNWNLCDRYLPYALGGGYVLSKNLITYIAKNSQDLMLFNSEDVSVGAWLAPVKVNRQHDCRFDTEAKSRGCSDRYLVTHKHDVDSMRRMYASIQRSGRLCEKEYQLTPGYNYNWNVPPSQCCVRNSNDPSIF